MSNKEIKEMREKAATLATEARSEIEKINDKTTPDQAKEIEARFDAIMKDHDLIIERAEREQRLVAAEARASKGIHGNPAADKEARGEEEPKQTEYREAFYEMLRAGGDLSELSIEARKVLRNGAVDVSKELRAQSVGTNSAGGFTVPVELQNMLIETMKAHGPMYDGSLVTEIITSGGNKLQMPTIDDTANSAAARAENAAMIDNGSGDVVFGQKELDSFVFSTPFVKWSMELSQDSIFNMETLLNNLIGKRLGRIANAQLTVGTGTSAPNGVVTASSLGKTAAGAAAVTSDELIDLYHSVDDAYRLSSSVRYMMNDTTLAAVRKLKDGQGNYLWQMGNIIQGVPQTLNGVPVVINQDMPAMTTGNKAILFGDFSQYFVRKVGAPVLGVMKERFWPDLGIAGLIRFDGELADTAAVKHLIMA